MKSIVLVAFTCVAVVAACDAFTPRIDPAPYPCHDPQSQWCDVQQTSCCKVWEACRPHGECEYVGPAGTPRDAGADR